VASFDDFLEIYKLMESALKPTLIGLSEKDLMVLNAIKELDEGAQTLDCMQIREKREA